jgi:hypothetical protein
MKKIFIYLILIIISFSTYAQNTDPYGGFLDIKGKKTGFFHAEQINNRWWLVTPEGNAFYGIGISHPITEFDQAAVTFTFKGDQEAWLNSVIQRMRDLGFNCVWSGPYCPERTTKNFVDKELAEKIFREAKIPYVFPIPLIKHDVELKEGELQPDVFSQEYVQHVKDLVEKYVPIHKDNPWVIGYYFGFGSFMVEEKWVNTTINRMDSPGRARLMSILEDRYQGNIKQFNKIYKGNYRSFLDLKENGTLEYPRWTRSYKFGYQDMPATEGAQEIFNDQQALLGEIIEHVYKLGHQEVRKYDRNHLLFGCYTKEATLTREMWHRVAPYIDVLCPQHLCKTIPIEPIVRELGKPAMISDKEVGNVYPVNLLTSGGAWAAIPSNLDRLVLYNIIAERISNTPEFIGVDICHVLFDQSHPDKPYEFGQPGFYTIYGEERPHLCSTTEKLNRKMLENVQKPADLEMLKEMDKKYHDVLKMFYNVVDERQKLLREYPLIPVIKEYQ